MNTETAIQVIRTELLRYRELRARIEREELTIDLCEQYWAEQDRLKKLGLCINSHGEITIF